jgi:hypothetical protein
VRERERERVSVSGCVCVCVCTSCCLIFLIFIKNIKNNPSYRLPKLYNPLVANLKIAFLIKGRH